MEPKFKKLKWKKITIKILENNNNVSENKNKIKDVDIIEIENSEDYNTSSKK